MLFHIRVSRKVTTTIEINILYYIGFHNFLQCNGSCAHSATHPDR